MRSMTGYGQAAREDERLRVNVTLRGVNHRFLDLSFRLREEWRELETELRERLSSRLHRGRVEVALEVVELGERRLQVRLDEAAVAALSRRGEELAKSGLVEPGLRFGELLRLPDLVRIDSAAPQWQDRDRALVLATVEEALEQLLAARALEGSKLRQVLEQRLDALARLAEELDERAAELPAEIAAALHQRIAELAAVPDLDPNRLAQEVALLVDRSDVSEEIDRLRSHLEHFAVILGQSGSLGKRLDFLTQEILRELNTIGTKCRDGEMTRRVLDGKVLCEQLREQIQNVE